MAKECGWPTDQPDTAGVVSRWTSKRVLVSTKYTEGPSDRRKSRSGERWRTSSNFTRFPVSDRDLRPLTGRTLVLLSLPGAPQLGCCRKGSVPVRILLETSRLQQAFLGFRIQSLSRARTRRHPTRVLAGDSSCPRRSRLCVTCTLAVVSKICNSSAVSIDQVWIAGMDSAQAAAPNSTTVPLLDELLNTQHASLRKRSAPELTLNAASLSWLSEGE
jgi:hypothetical protein